MHGLHHGGLAQHIADIGSFPKIEVGTRDLFLCELIYTAGTMLIKISFGLTLLRFVKERYLIQGIRAVIVVVSVPMVAIFFTLLFSCHPVSYSWKRVLDPYEVVLVTGGDPAAAGLKPQGTCMSENKLLVLTYLHSALVLLADIALGLVFPALLLKSLQMQRSLKISAWSLLALGATPALATIARLPFLHNLLKQDILFDITPVLLSSNIEVSLCVIGTSLTTLKPLVAKIDSSFKTFSEKRSVRDGSNNSSNAPQGGSSHRMSFRKHSQRTPDTIGVDTKFSTTISIHDKTWFDAEAGDVFDGHNAYR